MDAEKLQRKPTQENQIQTTENQRKILREKNNALYSGKQHSKCL